MMAETKNTKAKKNYDFPSDWEIMEFGEFAEVTKGKYNPVENGNMKCLELEHFEQGTGAINGWTNSVEQKSIKNKFVKGQVLFGKLRPYLQKYWFTDFDGVCSSEIWVLNSNSKKCTNEFLFRLVQTNKFIQVANVSSGSKMPRADWEYISNFPFPLPPLPEQKAIAQVLSTADTAIHTTEKLIAQKELRKKWLMQQLLTGKKRLKGFENTKWKIQPLENFVKPIVREIPKPSTPYLGIGLRSHGKGTFLKHDEQPEKNSMDNFYVVRPNDLIVNITFAWEQAIAIVRPEDDGALASHRFPTYTVIEDKGHPDFFRFYILQPRMKFMLQMISPGGAGRNRVMSKSDFIKLEFLLPEYKEQTAIAQVLQSADKEINLLKTKAEKLREQKKGLMQVLLTGKKRLKIENHE